MSSSWTPSGAGLIEQADGIWVTQEQRGVSYPDEGNEACFQVEDHSFWFAHRNRCIRAVVDRLPPNGKFVDVGGGNGFVAKALVDAGLDVTLVEPGQTGASNARRRGIESVVCGTFEQANFPRGSLGGIGVFDVIEHVEDDLAFVRTLRDSLRPNGRLFVTVPAFGALWSDDDAAAGHFRRYSPETLKQTLVRAGMRVELITCLFLFLPLPVFIFRRIPSMLGIRRTESAHALKEHQPSNGVVRSLLETALAYELRALNGGQTFRFGGSVLAVATPES